MVTVDLDRDYNINGVDYKAGKGVQVPSEVADTIASLKDENDKMLEFTHRNPEMKLDLNGQSIRD